MSEAAGRERVPCLVPFCRCSTAAARIAPNNEWVCARHWRAVPERLKLRYRAAKRLARRRERSGTWALAGKVWARCRSAAVEAAGGI